MPYVFWVPSVPLCLCVDYQNPGIPGIPNQEIFFVFFVFFVSFVIEFWNYSRNQG